jgi:hypothetical protein
MQNNGNDKSDKTINGDERYTPYYAVEPILKYLRPHSLIWCPFDKEWSAFVKVLRDAGHNVIATHIDNGEDFLLQPCYHSYDYVISNPPYSIKDEIINRLYMWDVPFMLLMPLPTLQGMKRSKQFKKFGIQLLSFDDRIGFHDKENMDKPNSSNQVASAYFCYNVLPKDLIIEELKKYDKELIIDNVDKL